jgi:hypothetical protein
MNENQPKNDLIDKIRNTLLQVFKKACLAEIDKSGLLSIDASHDQRRVSIFCEEVASRFHLQHLLTDQSNIGEDFYISFSPTDQLEDIFNRHKISKKIELVVTNETGEYSETLCDSIDVDNLVARVITGDHHRTTDRTIEELKSFYEDLNKMLLFTFIR